jgi:coenzyme F420-0:L-glutamate ligase/coenzyme F420-1:gamma-L-glutamate ligase
MIEIIFSRRSVRKFKPEPVPEEVVRRILESAHAAPSAHRSQPWRFVVLRDGAARRSLAERMAEAYARDADQISAAPLVVLALADESCLPAGLGRRAEGERLLLAQSVAAAVQNLLLAAHAEGLGACWICAPAFCPQTVGGHLRLPETWIAQALVLIGYPAEDPPRPEGRAIEEVVLWR